MIRLPTMMALKRELEFRRIAREFERRGLQDDARESDVITRLEADWREKGIVPGGQDDLPKIVVLSEPMVRYVTGAILQTAAEMQANQDMKQLEEATALALASGNPNPAIEASSADEFPEAIKPKVKAGMRASFIRGARIGEEDIRAFVNIRFDVMNPIAEQWALTQSSRLITEITEDQRDTVRELIRRAVGAGRTVKETAKDIRNAVGLQSRQVAALEKYRGRMNGKVADGAFSADKADKKVERYSKALLKQRGEVIARTEILTSAHAGQRGLWDEAARENLLNRAVTKIVWIVTPDELLCDICEAMDGDEIELNGSWELPDGTVTNVPVGHPNCRCSQGLVTDD